MNNLFRGLIAGYGAKKLGGGCLSTILVFVIIYWALGQCGGSSSNNNNNNGQQRTTKVHQQVAPAKI